MPKPDVTAMIIALNDWNDELQKEYDNFHEDVSEHDYDILTNLINNVSAALDALENIA